MIYVREESVESYFVRRMEGIGGLVRKVQWVGRKGAPDRVVFLPCGVMIWVELKSPGKKPSGHQQREIKRLTDLGQEVVVVDNRKAVDFLVSQFAP